VLKQKHLMCSRSFAGSVRYINWGGGGWGAPAVNTDANHSPHSVCVMGGGGGGAITSVRRNSRQMFTGSKSNVVNFPLLLVSCTAEWQIVVTAACVLPGDRFFLRSLLSLSWSQVQQALAAARPHARLPRAVLERRGTQRAPSSGRIVATN
jgi:hypothetical protein